MLLQKYIFHSFLYHYHSKNKKIALINGSSMEGDNQLENQFEVVVTTGTKERHGFFKYKQNPSHQAENTVEKFTVRNKSHLKVFRNSLHSQNYFSSNDLSKIQIHSYYDYVCDIHFKPRGTQSQQGLNLSFNPPSRNSQIKSLFQVPRHPYFVINQYNQSTQEDGLLVNREYVLGLGDIIKVGHFHLVVEEIQGNSKQKCDCLYQRPFKEPPQNNSKRKKAKFFEGNYKEVKQSIQTFPAESAASVDSTNVFSLPNINKVKDIPTQKQAQNFAGQVTVNECRYCTVSQAQRKLISPCWCKGSCGNICVDCLKKWTSYNIVRKGFGNVHDFQIGNHQCQICKFSFGRVLKVEDKLIELYEFSKPICPYMILCISCDLKPNHRRYVLVKGKCSYPINIGREVDCDIKLGDNTVSRKHARISFKNSRFHLLDLSSTFGTLIQLQNTTQVTHNHIQVQMGKSLFTFKTIPKQPYQTIDIKTQNKQKTQKTTK